MKRAAVVKMALVVCLVAVAAPWGGTGFALALGIAFALMLGNPWLQLTSRLSRITLQLSVVGLGFGLEIGAVMQTGKQSLLYTVFGIAGTLITGYLLGKVFGTDSNTSMLISAGTAICGGSAIAAMAPVLKARDDETAVALGTVFTLNAVALLLFPLVGHLLGLRQDTFGTWAGLAIHDTSSVVGAASAYGAEALKIGTTVKLTRAMWITPVVLGFALQRGARERISIPLFIIGFLLAATIRTALPAYGALWDHVAALAKHSLRISLFFVGLGLSREVFRRVGLRPMLQGVTLWLAVSGVTLAALMAIGIA
ncbi:putative sulfate exporter family transporter [Geomonas sp. Red69]|uniref:Sulfate exporter family transporter n=1 Tax=Geomonas diazotrophica TaxID=2843197 RepID=A0ABX8JNK7_9BACT|nr:MULTISPECIES: putative sulfate exporter family transporter [Geomonas]MBU5637253.1 putative sulfate exporter family transporter [Geomonas diazotrophica]QWV99546.1 putative sulfate exporter family transporter [Geomonas nitrogeniifigens]QXE88721.1 putative sulfate exporter family transporter [Geomonas nitrogeniifigens]